MADTMQFDLVAPERRLVSGQAASVEIPGAEGDMTVMPDHAPVVTTLRPGIVIVDMDDDRTEFAVTGGFAQISSEGTTILADEALPTGEVTSEFLQERIDRAHQQRQAADGSAADDIVKFLADLVAMGDRIGIAVESRAPAP